MKKINWDEVPTEEVTPSMHRKLIYGDRLMIAKMNFKKGFLVPLHEHHHEQITQVIHGKIRFWLGKNKEDIIDLTDGDVLVIPSNLPHEALMLTDVQEIDTWTPLREDWLDGTDHYLKNSK
ncbi:cupin domain-containing protein [Namhaeicola litoreus]|uniref:Cupin domain-containing protein n=1 Tax=Namhaeicola litoreus TaxID=1052145 RepID=A0ABW3Y470_9FLAO